MQTIRVLHVLPWVTSGGVERRRLALARNCPKHIKLRVITTTTNPEFRAALGAEGVDVVLGGTDWKVHDFRGFLAVAAEILRFRPHIVHGAVYEGMVAAAMGTQIARLQRPWRPYPRLIVEETSIPTRSRLGALPIQAAALAADLCVGVSPPVCEYWKTLGVPDQKIKLVMNGVEPNEFSMVDRQRIRKEHRIADDAIVIGSVGRVHALKNFDKIVTSISKVDRSDLVFLLVGKGPALEDVKQHAARLNVRAVFAGFQFDARPYYSAMDIFAHASSESFGLVFVEAMFGNRPIVTTSMGAAPEVLGTGPEAAGKLVHHGNVQQMTEVLETLAASPLERQRLGNIGHQRANRLFSAVRYSADLARVYEGLVQ